MFCLEYRIFLFFAIVASTMAGIFQFFDIEQHLTLIHYSGSWEFNSSFRIENAKLILEQPGFSLEKKTVFYIPGFEQHLDNPRTKELLETYLQLDTYNVIQLNYTQYSVTSLSLEYVMSWGVSSKVGDHFADAIQNMLEAGLDPGSVELVGHSLGSLVAGVIAQKITPNISLAVGLDLPGPLNFKSSLKAGVADYTIQLTTDSSLWGSHKHVCDVLYLPNGGSSQPGCPGEHGDMISCSHERSVYLWKYILLQPEIFVGIPCNETTNFCDFSRLSNLGPQFRIYGEYYFKTSGEAPYGLGIPGIYDYLSV